MLPGLFLWKKALKHSIEYVVSGCLKHMTRKEGDDYVCNSVFYVKSIESLSRPGLFLWKKALDHSKAYFVSGCMKPVKMSGNGVFIP